MSESLHKRILRALIFIIEKFWELSLTVEWFSQNEFWSLFRISGWIRFRLLNETLNSLSQSVKNWEVSGHFFHRKFLFSFNSKKFFFHPKIERNEIINLRDDIVLIRCKKDKPGCRAYKVSMLNIFESLLSFDYLYHVQIFFERMGQCLKLAKNQTSIVQVQIFDEHGRAESWGINEVSGSISWS